ncbi:hypothetical protein SAMN05518801_1136 [Novosphingobium sp. CF614]|uniref:hypothetical protein n=1 Tax=Novosphingobium sp. CF614 TaxID=1884364 RepID=UPI0008F2D221|nr:hypothetical protein [Novosphingobium sp. CF614]SFG26732.1 hypothetical protein SAMN05518801_1136 [Novosphingobium sp. CF614]
MRFAQRLRNVVDRADRHFRRMDAGNPFFRARAADYGYCLSIGEWERDVNSVGVPFVHPEHGTFAFNCGDPSFVLPREKLEDDIGPRLKHMVSQMRADPTGRA